MNKPIVRLITVAMVLTLVFTYVPTAFAAEKTAVYSGLQNIFGKGAVFSFDTTGKFSRSELKGTITIGGKAFDLNCTDKNGTVLCTAPRSIYMYGGQSAVLKWGGFTFSVTLPGDQCPYILIEYYYVNFGTGQVYAGPFGFTVPVEDIDAMLATKPRSVYIFNLSCMRQPYYYYPSPL